MTFVFALIGRNSVWLLTDRRLTTARGFTDDGTKTVHFDGTDGQGFMGYAGLGRTARWRQPSDWLKDQLKERTGLSIEESIGVIADAVKAQLPTHLRKIHADASHDIVMPVIVGGEPRLYHVGIAPGRFVHTRYVNKSGTTPRIGVAGSGASHLPRDSKWYRPLLRLLAHFEAGRIAAQTVADKLAEVNIYVAERDKFVSKKCLVSWRSNGGGHQWYDGTERDNSGGNIPIVANGIDLGEIVRVMLPLAIKQFEFLEDLNRPGFSVDELNEALAREHRPPNRDLK